MIYFKIKEKNIYIIVRVGILNEFWGVLLIDLCQFFVRLNYVISSLCDWLEFQDLNEYSEKRECRIFCYIFCLIFIIIITINSIVIIIIVVVVVVVIQAGCSRSSSKYC